MSVQGFGSSAFCLFYSSKTLAFAHTLALTFALQIEWITRSDSILQCFKLYASLFLLGISDVFRRRHRRFLCLSGLNYIIKWIFISLSNVFFISYKWHLIRVWSREMDQFRMKWLYVFNSWSTFKSFLQWPNSNKINVNPFI